MPNVLGATRLDNFKISAQWSRRMNSLKFWLTLRVHGRKAYEELIDRQLRLARRMVEWLQQSESFELAAPQVLPIVNFRLKLPGAGNAERTAAHHAFADAFNADGRRWISYTRVNGQSVLRMMIISYLTTEQHVTEFLEALHRTAQKLAATAK
jgi:glutamate/tyrosine decarboxylase-like PLP-dependent enzyme